MYYTCHCSQPSPTTYRLIEARVHVAVSVLILPAGQPRRRHERLQLSQQLCRAAQRWRARQQHSPARPLKQWQCCFGALGLQKDVRASTSVVK
jgi:hypothetical protein